MKYSFIFLKNADKKKEDADWITSEKLYIYFNR